MGIFSACSPKPKLMDNGQPFFTGEEQGHLIDSVSKQVRTQVIDSLKTIYEELKAAPEEKKNNEAKYSGNTWTDPNGKVYDLYTGKNGGKYIIRISQKTGKEYKYYPK